MSNQTTLEKNWDFEKTIPNTVEIIQSYLLTTSKRKYNIYGEKILMYLACLAQNEIYKMEFKNGKDLCPHTPKLCYQGVKLDKEDNAIVTIPLNFFWQGGKEHYDRLAEGLNKLQKEVLTFEGKNYEGKKVNIMVQFIGKVTNDHKELTLTIDKLIWEGMLDFSKGFTAYNLSIALNLKSIYALRFYQMLSRQKRAMTFTVEDLKDIFNLGEKYSNTNNLMLVLKRAKKELDAFSPYTFNYKVNYNFDVKTGRPPITAITIEPVHQIHLEQIQNIRGIDHLFMLNYGVKNILRDGYDFEDEEIKNNLSVFLTAERLMQEPTLTEFLTSDEFKYNIEKANNKKGYLVKAIINHLQEYYDIIVNEEKIRKRQQLEEQKLKERNKEIEKKIRENKKKEPKTLAEIMQVNS